MKCIYYVNISVSRFIAVIMLSFVKCLKYFFSQTYNNRNIMNFIIPNYCANRMYFEGKYHRLHNNFQTTRNLSNPYFGGDKDKLGWTEMARKVNG